MGQKQLSREPLRNTGSPAFAGDDGGRGEHHGAGGIRRQGCTYSFAMIFAMSGMPPETAISCGNPAAGCAS
jgi:hypothetical protein